MKCFSFSLAQFADYLVLANRQYIQRLEMDSFNLRTLYTDTTANFIAFDFDYRYCVAYISISVLKRTSIYCPFFSLTADTERISCFLTCRRGYQYWTHVSGSAGSIYRSNLEGGRVTTLISGSLQVPGIPTLLNNALFNLYTTQVTWIRQ